MRHVTLELDETTYAELVAEAKKAEFTTVEAFLNARVKFAARVHPALGLARALREAADPQPLIKQLDDLVGMPTWRTLDGPILIWPTYVCTAAGDACPPERRYQLGDAPA